MGIIGTLFAKAQPERRDSDAPGSPLGVWKGAKQTVVVYSAVMAAQEALEHPVVFRCLNKIAESVQTVRWYAEADPFVSTNERAGVREISAMNALLNSPGGALSADQLRYWMALNYASYSRVPFKVGVTIDGKPNGIYPLAARFVTSVKGAAGWTVAYEYGIGADGKRKVQLPNRRYAERSGSRDGYIHEITKPDLDGLQDAKCSPVTILNSIGLPAMVIKLLLQRAADTASGHPNTKYIITTEKTLTNEQKKAIRQYAEEAAPEGDESGNILFLYNTAITVHNLNDDLSDIHSKMPLDDMSRMIAGAFGIPIALIGLGAADGAKFASNYAESRRAFWEDTIIPGYLSPFATGLTQALCPYGMRISFDYDTISAISDTRVQLAERLSKVSYLTRDEKREMSGFAPTEDGTGGTYDNATASTAPVATDITEENQ